MIRLIVNSDDYGRTAEVSRGIRQAHMQGIVSSTTCMMNMPTTAEDILIALRETPRLGLGVHLVLTVGKPVSDRKQVPTLTTAEGRFPKPDQLVARLDAIDPAEAKVEWQAQIEAFVAVVGRNPTHLDSHHHSSYFTAGLFRAMLELARDNDCAVRLPGSFAAGGRLDGFPGEGQASIREYGPRLLAEFEPRCPDAFYASFYDDQATTQELLRIVDSLQAGAAEVMCHPGYADASLIDSSIYARQRERELDILTDPSVIEALEQKNIQLITFADL